MINFEVLKGAVAAIKGGTFAGIDTETEVKLLGGKKNPMQGRVTKRTTGATVMIFCTKDKSAYENMVRKRMDMEGLDATTFELKPRAWGQRIEGTPFVEHKGKHYLECFFMNAGETEYFLDGKPIAKEDIEGLPEKKDSEESQGGIENKVILRTFAIESLRRLRIKKTTIM